VEQSTGKESLEEMYVYISGESDKLVSVAQQLTEDLLITVRQTVFYWLILG
jgi:hypothetical protein